MKSDIFRSVDFWKSAIMTMPDNSFFELVRSVFGKIKTPFNKQQLVNDLEAFLLREDIRKAVSCYIDGNDAKIIAAIAALGEPAPGELESFFSGELSYSELHDIVVNLEERFILYRFMEETASGGRTPSGLGRLAINPVLEQVLEPFARDSSLLFLSVSAEDTETGEFAAEAGGSVLNDPVLAGFLTYVSEEEPSFNAEGEIRKRTIEAAKTIFPDIDFESVLGSLQALGLLYADDDRLFADYRRFADFGVLSPRERIEYCAAGIMCSGESESPFDIVPPLVRGRIYILTIFIHRFLDSLEERRLYPEKTLKRIVGIIQRDRIAQTWRSNTRDEILDINKLIEALEKTGLLIPVSGGLKRLGPSVKKQAADLNGPVIAPDSDFSFQVYPEINYKDAIGLASFMSISKAGMTVRFEMTREAAVRAFDRNICADWMTELLTRLSGNRISETLIWTLKEWEKRYSEVSLRQGLILSLSEDRRYLVETKALAKLIRETVAPGIYLLYDDVQNEAAKALALAGVDIVARRSESLNKNTFQLSQNHFSSPNIYASHPSVKNPVSGPENPAENNAAALIGEFRAKLKKMPLGKLEKDELAARIDRRLVLCETQLTDAGVRYEKLEARLLDYAGKLNIAKQAVSQHTPVELHWQGRQKEEPTTSPGSPPVPAAEAGGRGSPPVRIFGIPRALEKDGGEFFLIISPDDVPAAEAKGRGSPQVPAAEAGGRGSPPVQEALRIPIGKISLLRRIKKSIFENKE